MIILSKLKDFKSNDLIELKCTCCKNSFYKKKKLVLDSENRNPRNSYLFCSKECQRWGKNILIKCSCYTCGKEIVKYNKDIEKTKHNKPFCSRSCSSKFTLSIKDYQSIWTREKRNECSIKNLELYKSGLRNKIYGVKKERDIRTCRCGSVFESLPSSKKKYCNRKCWNNYSGGYKKNSTIVHRSIYNGQQMDSGAERIFAIILDKNNIKWYKNDKIFYNYFYLKQRKYYPDFYLEELKIWVEIKGKKYIEPCLSNKLQSISNNGEKIILILSDELKDEKEVIKKLGL